MTHQVIDFFSPTRMRTVLKSYHILLRGFTWALMVSFGRSPHQALRLNSFFSGCNVFNYFCLYSPGNNIISSGVHWKYWHSHIFCNDCAKIIKILRFMNTNCPDTNSSKSHGYHIVFCELRIIIACYIKYGNSSLTHIRWFSKTVVTCFCKKIFNDFQWRHDWHIFIPYSAPHCFVWCFK